MKATTRFLLSCLLFGSQPADVLGFLGRPHPTSILPVHHSLQLTGTGVAHHPFFCQNLSTKTTSLGTTPRTTTTELAAIPSFFAFGPGPSAATAAASTMISLGRESYNLQSMAAYSTVTALIMNASLRLYTSQKFSAAERSKLPSALFTAATTLCIISGIYTAVLFNILGIYAKESLGMGNDLGYIAFQQATAIYRTWGFRSFLVTCISFVGGFLLSVFGNVTEGGSEPANGVDKLILGTSIFLVLAGAFQIRVILNMATRYIFAK